MPDGTPESTANETPASVRVFRFDRQGEPDFQFETREDGSILTVARAAVCGVMRYQVDGVERLELVDEETLNDPAYLTGFRYRATTLEHPDKMVTPENIRNYRRGTTTERSEYRDEAHYLGVVLDDAEMLAAVEDGKHEVSPGYECDLLETPGVHPKYGRYDAIQRNRKPNHFAVCNKARGGSTVRLLRTDSAEPATVLVGERVHVDAEPPAPPPLPTEPPVYKMSDSLMSAMKAHGVSDDDIASCKSDDDAHAMLTKAAKKDEGKADEVSPEVVAMQKAIADKSAELEALKAQYAAKLEEHEMLADDAAPAALESLADDGPMMADDASKKMDSARRDSLTAGKAKTFAALDRILERRAELVVQAHQAGVSRADSAKMGNTALVQEIAKRRLPAELLSKIGNHPAALNAALLTAGARTDSASGSTGFWNDKARETAALRTDAADNVPSYPTSLPLR